MAESRKITGFRAGDPLRIQRRVGWTRPEFVGSSLVDLKIRRGNQVILAKQARFREDAPEFRSLPGASLQANPQVKSFHFDLSSHETRQLRTDEPYTYSITAGTGNPHLQQLESGFLVAASPTASPPGPPPPPPGPPPPPAFPGSPDYALPTAYTSYADRCVTVSGRYALLIDGWLDAILGAYRQLKVWDEHARRRGDNPFRLQLTYEYINHYTPIEIWDSNNNPVITGLFDPYNQSPPLPLGSPVAGRLLLKDASLLLSPPPPSVSPPASSPPPPPPSSVLTLADFDYRNGNFSILNDDGNQDFFVTYTFDFFPESVLLMFIQQTVLEMNFIGAGAGTYATNYTNIDEIPEAWLGLVALGVAAKAWKKLATDISIWRNWLIFDGDVGEGITAPTGATAQQVADSASQYYQAMFQEFAAGTKYEKFLAQPTIYWQIFATSGYGSFGPYVMGNKVVDGTFRGMVINKGWSY